MNALVDSLLKGLKFEKRREDSLVLKVEKRVVAEVLIQKARIRINFRNKLGKPAQATKSQGLWSSFVYVTDEKEVPAVRKLIETAISGEVQKVTAAAAKPVAKRTRKPS